MIKSRLWPAASAAEYPKTRAAPLFQSRMTPSASVTTMASADSVTIALASHASFMVLLLSTTVLLLRRHRMCRWNCNRVQDIAYCILTTCRSDREEESHAVTPARVFRGGGQGTAFRARRGRLLCLTAGAVHCDRQAGTRTRRHPDSSRAELRGSDAGGRTARRLGQATARRGRR